MATHDHYYSLAKSVVLSARQSAFLYGERLDYLLLKDYPLKSPKQLIEHVRGLIVLIDNQLAHLQYELEAKKKELVGHKELCDDIIDSAQINSQFIDVLLKILRMIEMSTREYTPQPAVFFVRQLCDGMNLKAKFFLNPIPSLNFGFQNVTGFLDGILSLDATESSPKTNVVVLSFPETHQSDPVSHSLIAHEIGHWINEENSVVDNVFSTIIQSVAFTKDDFDRIKKDLKIKEPEISIVGESQILSLFAKQVKNWLTEIASDLVGVRLLGPVFVFTLVNLLLRLQNADSCSTEYPSTRMRARIALDYLEALKYHEVISGLSSVAGLEGVGSEFLSAYKGLKAYVLSNPQSGLNSHLDTIVFNLLTKGLTDLKTEVDHAIGVTGYSQAAFKHDIPLLVAALAALVPPCETETGEPANVASIVNAGLVFLETSAIEKLQNLLGSDLLHARSNVNALTFKAIELSTIHKSMK